MIEDINVKRLLAESDNLPTMPAVASQLLVITEWENVDLGKVAETISKDVSLTSKILRVVNSPFYGLGQEISTISQALVVLGARATRSLTLSFSILTMCKGDGTSRFDYPGFWTRSLNTAAVARELAFAVGLRTEEEAFLAGLLQNMGVMVVARCVPQLYARVVGEAGDKLAPSLEAEREHLGIDHVEVAKLLFEKWNLPASLCIPIFYHHTPEKANNAEGQTLTSIRIQYFAGRVGEWLYSHDGDDALLQELKKEASQYFDISPNEFEALMYRVDTKMEEMSELFELSKSRPNTYANLLEQANLKLGDIVSKQERLLRELEAAKVEAQTLAEQLRIANNKLLEEARRDPLTDLPNRRLFEEFLRKELERSIRYHHPIALLFIDIDDFKSLNDRYGHLEGDSALRQVAHVLGKGVRVSDIVARYGGEEFIVALVETRSTEAMAVAERLRRSIEETPIHSSEGDTPIRLTASIGATTWEPPSQPVSIDELIEEADRAMYRAKKAGKNCVVTENEQVPQ